MTDEENTLLTVAKIKKSALIGNDGQYFDRIEPHLTETGRKESEKGDELVRRKDVEKLIKKTANKVFSEKNLMTNEEKTGIERLRQELLEEVRDQ